MNELESWLILSRIPGVGLVRAQKLLEIFASPQEIIESSLQEKKQTGLFPKPALDFFDKEDFSIIEQDLALLKQDNTSIIHIGHADYPSLLMEIHDPPLVLYLRGNVNILSMPQIAIVGSRNPDSSGKRLSYTFAKTLAGSGLIITSGMASGIDSAAHLGALEGGGSTVAIMGTGLDRVYPAKNKKLAHMIAEAGFLVSEFPPGTSPKAENFPRRNRIISGLSLGTLVVQAVVKSGSLISARLASEQGREVFAVPGSINNPLSRGPHELIRQGAKLVETADDIFEELQGMLGYMEKTAPVKSKNNPKISTSLLQHIEYEPMLMDDLVSKSNLDMNQISAELLDLELAGQIEILSGGRLQRI